METLNKDMLVKIALEFDLPSILRFCSSGKRINEKVCKNTDFWYNKLKKDFTDYQKLNLNKTLKDIYILLYNLTVLKDKLNKDFIRIKESIYDLYNRRELNLMRYSHLLRDVPKEIENLVNLETLYLSHNKIKYLPKEIWNLFNLKKLYLDNNKLTEIPKEIQNLVKLKSLSLSGNRLTYLPKEIAKLSNLKVLNLSYNALTGFLPGTDLSHFTNLEYLFLENNRLISLPEELGDLPKLQELHFRFNHLNKLPENITNNKRIEIDRNY